MTPTVATNARPPNPVGTQIIDSILFIDSAIKIIYLIVAILIKTNLILQSPANKKGPSREGPSFVEDEAAAAYFGIFA